MKDFNLEEMILEETKYISGYKNEEDKYVISASMIGKEPLQNYLSIIHGKGIDNKIGDNTLGTMLHLAMEQIVYETMEKGEMGGIVGSEISLHHELSNGWILSGTADLITEPTAGHYQIRDYKFTKNYTKKMMEKSLETHDYTKQIRALEALFRVSGIAVNGIDGNIELICDFFMKDSKAIEHEAIHQPLVVPNQVGTEDVNATDVTFNSIVAITDSLQAYIESGEVPPKCTDLWPRKVKGKEGVINMKCEHYCSHNQLCPYYRKDTKAVSERFLGW